MFCKGKYPIQEKLRRWLDETKLPKHGNIIKVFHTLCNLKVTQDPFSSIWMLQNTLSNCKKFWDKMQATLKLSDHIISKFR